MRIAVALVAHAAAYLAGMEAGWTESLDRLAEELVRCYNVRQLKEEFIQKAKRRTECKKSPRSCGSTAKPKRR